MDKFAKGSEREETQLSSGDSSPGFVIMSCEGKKARAEVLPRLLPLSLLYALTSSI